MSGEGERPAASLCDALDALSADERRLLALRFGAGLSLEETARAMGLGLASARRLQLEALRGVSARLAAAQGRPPLLASTPGEAGPR